MSKQFLESRFREDIPTFKHTDELHLILTSSSSATPDLLHSTAQHLLSSAAATKSGLWLLQTILFDVASDFPDVHPGLITLYFTLQGFSTAAEVPAEASSAARDLLSSYGADWRSHHDGLWAWRDGALKNEAEKRVPTWRRWIHFNAFSAKTLQTGFDTSVLPFALRNIHDVLDFSAEEIKGPNEGRKATVTGMQLVGADVAMASQWFLCAAEAMWDARKMEGEEDVWGKAMDHRESLWKGEKGFTAERWVFWRERFGVLAKLGISGEAQELAKRAAERMSSVEKRSRLLREEESGGGGTST